LKIEIFSADGGRGERRNIYTTLALANGNDLSMEIGGKK